MKKLTAKEARKIADKEATKWESLRESQIQKDVNELLLKIEREAKKGVHEVVFGTRHIQYRCDTEEVRSRLRKLGYYFSEESDMGMHCTMICWR